jgi:hypothetical protein
MDERLVLGQAVGWTLEDELRQPGTSAWFGLAWPLAREGGARRGGRRALESLHIPC